MYRTPIDGVQLEGNIAEQVTAMAGRIPLRQAVTEQMILNSHQFLQIEFAQSRNSKYQRY